MRLRCWGSPSCLDTAGRSTLAQAAFFGIGAYGVALGTTAFGLPFWVALLLGVVAASVAGAVLGLMSLRLGGHYLAMVTISFQTILSLVLTNWIDFTQRPRRNLRNSAARSFCPAVVLISLSALPSYTLSAIWCGICAKPSWAAPCKPHAITSLPPAWSAWTPIERRLLPSRFPRCWED